MSALETLFNKYVESPRLETPESEALDKLNKFAEKYIKGYDVISEFEALICDFSYETEKAAFRAGFIAGAYPLQEVR
jgi:hypothetical protein